MADVDIHPFGGASGEHDRPESRPDEQMDENIPLPLLTPMGGST